MNQPKPQPVTLPTPGEIMRSYKPNLTRRGELTTNIVAGIGAVAVVATGVILGLKGHEAEQATNQPTAADVAQNETRIEGANLLSSSFTLKSGVNVRLSPNINNGDNHTGEADNIVDNLIPKGKTLSITSGIPLGDGWVAFQRPKKHEPKTLHDRAEDLVYVNEADISNNPSSADKISDFSIVNQEVQFNGSDYVYPGSAQQATGALESHLQ